MSMPPDDEQDAVDAAMFEAFVDEQVSEARPLTAATSCKADP
jgi:hypothetical protein